MERGEGLDEGAAALSRANSALSEAHDRLGDATPAAFVDEDDHFRAARLEAG